MDEQTSYYFSLDIGTRSVIGIIAEINDSGQKIIACEKLEHNTRAMLDGQIHDIPQVAKVLSKVTHKLEEKAGPLKRVAVAAAGRALCTLQAEFEQDIVARGWLHADDVRMFELNAVQEAQYQLAQQHASIDAVNYYCVGYSVVSYKLDGNAIKNLQGQRGQKASVEVIATFLPRVVIDSLQSALTYVGLEIQTLTLEPIAAINALIPTTMRHLNLVLVDIGAGTSDVAITANGAVSAYGMVPCAGDEITEAISQHYLLDFNVAEKIKRQLNKKTVSFTDVLGSTQKVQSAEIIKVIEPAVTNLAALIAEQIHTLNRDKPLGVILVGGGSLTPGLPEALAEAIGLEIKKVAIRVGKSVAGFSNLPKLLQGPDAITPLGIAKLANERSLSFINICVNEANLSLFDLGRITLSDALLVAGIDTRTLHGKPGMAIAVDVNGQTEFIRGQMGSSATLTINGQKAALDHDVHDGDVIVALRGHDGCGAQATVADVVTPAAPAYVKVNGESYTLTSLIHVNQQPADENTPIVDRDIITIQRLDTVSKILCYLGFDPSVYQATVLHYHYNGIRKQYVLYPEVYLNSDPCVEDTPVKSGDIIALNTQPPELPTLEHILDLHTDNEIRCMTVTINDSPLTLNLSETTIEVDGKKVSRDYVLYDGANITIKRVDKQPPILSDLLVYLEVDPSPDAKDFKIKLEVNGRAAEYLTELQDGDKVVIC